MIIEGAKTDGTPKTVAVDDDGKVLVEGQMVIEGKVAVESSGAKDTATVSRVSASATAVTLLAANTNRRRVIIYNDSTAVLRVKLGSAASATDYTYRLGAGDTYESPTDWVYTGIVTGIWDSATGAAQVTEI